jgi:hypothetical protein
MNTDTHAAYYTASRGYGWADMAEMRNRPAQPITAIPEVFQDRFQTVQEYTEWLAEQHKNYFG